ncbi:hypothetical protein [Stygiolobus caldivivus]|uniref:Uncharacterized protein n=1 Tax=Stygiolobus caldivivus TaxID=2824673 RepID=A0A8D5ZI30_9CREN|nr:hypothetical protein [Stygiolobus caldivivus]BCU68927.1 hypothetical protein KN1_02240 [Stygiolobus caldivivus]
MNRKTLAILSLVLVLLIATELFLVLYYHYKVHVNYSIFSPPSSTRPQFFFPNTSLKGINLTLPISVKSLIEYYYNITYNSSLELFSECPYVNKYYVESDNLLAVIALKYLNNSLWKTVWQNIESNLTLSPYLVLAGIHNFSWEFKTPVNVKVWGPIYTVSFNKSPDYLSWYEYADTSLLFAIYEAENGNITLAEKVFSIVINDFWDGYGFADESFSNGSYTSYKLALAVIAWKYIGSYNQTFAEKYLPIIKKIYQISSHLLSPIGGFFTNYEVLNGTIVPIGNVNTETTSLFTIALFMP